jgi:DJ-1/PfpI family
LAGARLDDYDAVYYPGGHGPMEDLWKDADSGRLLTAALASGKPLAIVCHAPVAMLATRRNGVSPFAGYRVTAYTNDEEYAVGLRSRAFWTAEDELVKLGVEFTRVDMWQPYTVVDRNLYTGQNPASAAPREGNPHGPQVGARREPHRIGRSTPRVVDYPGAGPTSRWRITGRAHALSSSWLRAVTAALAST